MSSCERKQQLKKFLAKFDELTIGFSQKQYSKPPGLMQQFIIAYFGKCFIQGYRIIQKIDQNIFVLSLMQCQIGGNPNFHTQHQKCTKHGQIRIIDIEFNEKINEQRNKRTQKYQILKQIAQFFCNGGKQCNGIQYHFLFAVNFMYSVVGIQTLNKNSILHTQKFYNRDYGVIKKDDKQGFKILDQIQQGKKLHLMVELYLKGNGAIINRKYFTKNVLHHSKFSYKLDKVINNVCLAVGKQMIEGRFTTVSIQKWIRKFSTKSFRRFDLLLRNQKKVCIIDWKFSRDPADDKIKTKLFVKKNLQYFQLARKQYNAQVQLKFYCFHQLVKSNYHDFTVANYDPSIQKIQIEDIYKPQDNQIQIQSDNQVQIIPQISQKNKTYNFNNNNKVNIQIQQKEKPLINLQNGKNIDNNNEQQQFCKIIFNEIDQTFKFQKLPKKRSIADRINLSINVEENQKNVDKCQINGLQSHKLAIINQIQNKPLVIHNIQNNIQQVQIQSVYENKNNNNSSVKYNYDIVQQQIDKLEQIINSEQVKYFTSADSAKNAKNNEEEEDNKKTIEHSNNKQASQKIVQEIAPYIQICEEPSNHRITNKKDQKNNKLHNDYDQNNNNKTKKKSKSKSKSKTKQNGKSKQKKRVDRKQNHQSNDDKIRVFQIESSSEDELLDDEYFFQNIKNKFKSLTSQIKQPLINMISSHSHSTKIPKHIQILDQQKDKHLQKQWNNNNNIERNSRPITQRKYTNPFLTQNQKDIQKWSMSSHAKLFNIIQTNRNNNNKNAIKKIRRMKKIIQIQQSSNNDEDNCIIIG